MNYPAQIIVPKPTVDFLDLVQRLAALQTILQHQQHHKHQHFQHTAKKKHGRQTPRQRTIDSNNHHPIPSATAAAASVSTTSDPLTTGHTTATTVVGNGCPELPASDAGGAGDGDRRCDADNNDNNGGVDGSRPIASGRINYRLRYDDNETDNMGSNVSRHSGKGLSGRRTQSSGK